MLSVKPAVVLAASLPVALAVSIVAAPGEWELYDARLPLRSDPGWPADLATVALEERTIASLGGWPLPAESLASLLDALDAAGAKTVVVDVFLGFAGDLDEQAILAPRLARTVTAVTFDPADGRRPTGDELRRALVPASAGPEVAAAALSFPPERISSAVLRLGHSGFAASDSVRSSPPLVRVEGFDGALPSQPLAALIAHRDLDPAGIRAAPSWIALPDRPRIALVRGETLLDLVPGGAPPRAISAAELLAGTLAPGSLAGALVVVHVDTPEDRHVSPLGAQTPGGVLLASAIRTLDGGRSPRILPFWAALLLCAASGFVALQLPGARRRFIACAIFEAMWLAAAIGLVPVADVFLPVIGPIVVFAGAHAASVLSGFASASDDRVAPS